jgi:hypothetical protein
MRVTVDSPRRSRARRTTRAPETRAPAKDAAEVAERNRKDGAAEA